ncbi:hypothetical protein K435DRAFT_793969 [Dendrothele bispora CBS 962.96]|uniref:Uncharacterized protein n=1 Tax=Dendrothele bispora (strain CBS 962.96) TaxID=1314807 RepID=A0A4S8MDL4_DENBC|nr:hypothetical protein K435DRAFT_793969 [Dendrothele bispora CBS 962.96]
MTEECATTTLIFFVQKYNPEFRYDFCLSTGVPTFGTDCVLAKPDIYLNVTTSIPIQSPIPTKAFAAEKTIIIRDDCRINEEYEFIARPESRKPIHFHYGPGSSSDTGRPISAQHTSQRSNTNEEYSTLIPTQTETRYDSIVATKGVQSRSKISSDNQDETPSGTVKNSYVPCDFQSFAAHYGANSFSNKWAAATDQTYGTYSDWGEAGF